MRALLALALILPLALAGCSGDEDDDGMNHDAGEHMVTIRNNAFSPTSLAIRQGDTVVFHNDDGVTHTATLDSGERDTGNIAAGKSGEFSLPTPGSLRYHCKIHPSMTGTIVVAAD